MTLDGTIRPLTVAYQGEPGAFSEMAIRARWGHTVRALPCREFADAVSAVTEGRADCAMLPVRNTIAGPVEASSAAIAASSLETIGELDLPISLCLMAPAGATLEELRTVQSHPVALGQCRLFLAAHPWLQPLNAYDTAGAAREVAHSGDRTRGAIAAAGAASLNGLTILAPGIEDRASSVTHFVVVARAATAAQQRPLGAGPALAAVDGGRRR